MAIIGCECLICGKLIQGIGLTPPFPICEDCCGTLKKIVAERKVDDLINQADALIDFEKELIKGEWISTNGNNLPRPFQRVLVCNEFGDIEIGYLKEDCFWKKDGTFPIVCPVAWMPLPEPYPWKGATND